MKVVLALELIHALLAITAKMVQIVLKNVLQANIMTMENVKYAMKIAKMVAKVQKTLLGLMVAMEMIASSRRMELLV